MIVIASLEIAANIPLCSCALHSKWEIIVKIKKKVGTMIRNVPIFHYEVVTNDKLSHTPPQIRTISTERLGKKIGRASDEEVNAVIEGLMDIIG